jgi:hypothetical protein
LWGLVLCLFPRRIAVVAANASAPPHSGSKPVARLGDSGKTVTCLELPAGANRKVIAATIAAAHCAAMRCVYRCGGYVAAISAPVRCCCVPRYHNNLRRGRRPRRPLSCLPQMFASNHCTLLCWCVGCPRLPSHFVRRDTQRLAHYNNTGRTLRLAPNHAGAPRGTRWSVRRNLSQRVTHRIAAQHSAGRGAGGLRQILVGTRRYRPLANRAKAHHPAALSEFGRTDT